MRSLRYLNGVLTVLAVLLTLQLWTTWTTASGVEGPRDRSVSWLGPQPAYADGIPNPGGQRKQMIDLLKLQVRQTETLIDLFKSGQAKVLVQRRGKNDD